MAGLVRACLDAPRATLAGITLITALLGFGVTKLTTETGYRSFLGADHPAVVAFDKFIDAYGGGLPLAAVWSCAETPLCESVFDVSALEMAKVVSRVLEATPGVRRVESPATSSLLVPSSDGFDIRRFSDVDGSSTEHDLLVGRARIDPLWEGTLIALDATVGAIVIELASSGSDVNFEVVGALREALTPFEEAGFRFHLVGDPVEYVVAGGELDADTGRLVPVMVVLIGLTIFVLFRSFFSVVVVLATVGIAVLWTMGLMGWIGWPQTNVTQPLAPLILVIGVCNGIHVLSQCAASSRRARVGETSDRTEDLVHAARHIGGPCTIAALTTAAGFLSFTTSGLESFARFGVIAAVGIMSSLLLSFSLLPVLLRWAPRRSFSLARVSGGWDTVLTLIVRGASRRYVVILLASGVVLVVSGFGIANLRIDADIYALYGEQSQVVKWARFVENHLRKPDTLEIDLVLPDDLTLEDPRALAQVAEVAAFASSVKGLGRARSIVDLVTWVHRIDHDDDPEFQRIGESAEANAELLFLLSLEGAETLDPWMTLSKQRTRISVEANKEPQTRRTQIIEEVEAGLAEMLDPGWSAKLTGPLVVAHDLVEEVQKTQLRSLSAAIIVVLLLVFAFLRNFGWAALAMIPTTLPVLLTLGAMGLWGITLDVGTAMVSAIVIGIAVDDTVHLLYQYRRHREEGAEATEAIERSIIDVGQAVVTTSVALTIGLFALTLSPWQSVASFGFLSGLAIMGALIADLSVLPALIVLVARSGRAKEDPL